MHRILSRRDVAAACALSLFLVLAPVADVSLTAAQDSGTSELEDWERAELQALVDVVGAALRGELVQLEDPFTLTLDFLKGTDNLTYVPFNVTLDPASLSESSVAMYLYVTLHVDAPSPGAVPEGDDDDDDDDDAPGLPEAVFEDVFFIDVSAAKADGGPIVLSRPFTAESGVYDVYVAIRDSLGEVDEDDDADAAAPAPQVLMVKSEVEVPDFWSGELQTSSVILAQVVEPLDRPLTPDEQRASPYTLGTTRIVPKQDGNFVQTDELSLIMLVYNPSPTSDQTPDLTIEYDFHKQTDTGEEFFNKTNPQEFNSETLPPGFDLTAGHQIVAGQSVPLSIFPVGDFRLQITVTDNASGTSLVRDVNISVSQ